MIPQSYVGCTNISIDYGLMEKLESGQINMIIYDGIWNDTTTYNLGDIVRHTGYMYYAISNNVNSKPFISSDGGSTDWIVLAKNINFRGKWLSTNFYKTGDVVLRGGNLYVALVNIGGEFVVLEAGQSIKIEKSEKIDNINMGGKIIFKGDESKPYYYDYYGENAFIKYFNFFNNFLFLYYYFYLDQEFGLP